MIAPQLVGQVGDGHGAMVAGVLLHVQEQRADAEIVQTVTSLRAAPPPDARTKLIEKPFELARLARLLGVATD